MIETGVDNGDDGLQQQLLTTLSPKQLDLDKRTTPLCF